MKYRGVSGHGQVSVRQPAKVGTDTSDSRSFPFEPLVQVQFGIVQGKPGRLDEKDVLNLNMDPQLLEIIGQDKGCLALSASPVHDVDS